MSSGRISVVFVYSGLGSYWPGMASDLLRNYPVFAARFREADDALVRRAGISVLGLAEGDATNLDPGAEHALNFAFQTAMTAHLGEWGIEPDCIAGHSAGEVAGAVESGVLTLEEGASLVAEHARVLDGWGERCGLAFVAMPLAEALAAAGDIDSNVSVAAVNDPGSVVFSGPPERLDVLVARMANAGVFARRLPLHSPLHHPWLAPRLDAMRRALGGLRPRASRVPVLSSWRGGPARPGDFGAEYWVSHVRDINRFGDAVLSLPAGSYLAVEIAPHSLLGDSLRTCFKAAGLAGTATAVAKRNEHAAAGLNRVLLEARRGGLNLEWAALPNVVGEEPDTSTSAPTENIADWPEDGRRGRLADALAGMVKTLTGGGTADVDSGFLESGLDSLGLVALQAELRTRFGVEIGPETFFRYPTPLCLADRILGNESPDGTAPVPTEAARGDGVAVVGMACRLPGGVDSPEAYWRLLIAGKDAIVPVPPDRWDKDAWYDPDPHRSGKTHTRSGGFLRDPVGDFDAEFFGMAAAEADALDPQQRLFLETAWEALESAGIDPASLKGARVGVFLGLSADDFAVVHRYADPRRLTGYSLTGSTGSTACGRVSFFLGLEGPSYVVDTACSSSLACLHLARRALLDGEVDMALVGGANVMLIPEIHVCFSKLGATSADGRCKTFDASANGYGRGEGAGMVVLKRLADARRDGDPVLVVVRGSAVNSDGRSSSLTAPNGRAQAAVARQALAQAGWSPDEVHYIETHGTGTPLGDAVEATALGEVYGVFRPDAQPPLRIGSAKPMIGHLEAAAGVASFIKVALAVKNSVIPASIGCETPNPQIEWNKLRVEVNLRPSAWPEGRRRAGISAFGIGGTNCHALLEDSGDSADGKAREMDGEAELLVLSARTPEALRAACGRWAEALGRDEAPTLADACHTSLAGRTRFRRRAAVSGKDRRSMAEALSRLAASDATGSATIPAAPPPVVFLFPGQGAQRAGMGRALYRSYPVYREAFDEAAAAFAGMFPVPLAEAVLGESADTGRLSGHLFAQASMFAAGVATTTLWRSWGVNPSAVAGHSVGEYAAAWAAGALRLGDAARLVAERALAMDRLPPGGGMAAARMDAGAALASFARLGFPGLEVAAANAPESITVSGPVSALRAWGEALRTEGVEVKPLAVSGAFHSVAVEPVLERLLTLGRETPYAKPDIDWWSTRRAAPMEGCDFGGYWAEQTRGSVRFMDAVRTMHEAGAAIFVEMGPGTTLCGLGRATCPDALFLPGMGAAGQERETALRTLGALWERGVNPDPAGLNPGGRARRVSMPTYPFQRRRHWNAAQRLFPDPAAGAVPSAAPPQGQPYLGSALDGPGVEGNLWESLYSDSSPDFMSEHVILGRSIAPAAAYVSLAISAAAERWGTCRPLELSDFEFNETLIGESEHPRRVRVVLDPVGTFTVSSRDAEEPGGSWVQHARGKVRLLDTAPDPGMAPPPLSGTGIVEEGHDAIYRIFLGNNYALGESFRHIQSARITKGAADCIVDCTPPKALGGLRLIHPGIMDSIIQTGMPAIGAERENYLAGGQILIPMRIDRLIVWDLPSGLARCLCTLRHTEGATVNHLDLFDANGRRLMLIDGMILRRVSRESLYRDVRRHPALFVEEWRDAPLPEKSRVAGWILAGDSTAEVEAVAMILRESGVENIHPIDSAGGRAGIDSALTGLGGGDGEWRFVFACGAGGDDDGSARRVIGGAYAFAQALAEAGLLERGRLWLLDRAGDGSLWSGALRGFGRSLRQEHSSGWGGMVCVDSWRAPGLAAILSAAPSKEDEWRLDSAGPARVPRLSPLARPGKGEAAEAVKRAASRIRGGAHWITGGAGALGRSLAGWLLRHGAARVILTGRRAADAGVEALLAGLNAQARDGATVEYRRCDAADAVAVRELAASLADGPPLKGVFHAAGTLEDGALSEKTWESVWAALSAKALGAWNLHAATAGMPLEMFVMFSSASALLGSAGQTAYASANSALDGLARRRRAEGLPALSVQWGPWAGGGMAADPGRGDRLARLGMDGLNPGDALHGLEQAMSRDAGVVAIMHIDWPVYFGNWLAGPVPGRFDQVRPQNEAETTGDGGLAERLATAPRGKWGDIIETWLDETARRLLGRHERLDPDAPLLEQGFDSLMAIEWRGYLAKALDKRIPSSFLFDYPTLRRVTDFLLDDALGEGDGRSEAKRTAPNAADEAKKLLNEIDELLNES